MDTQQKFMVVCNGKVLVEPTTLLKALKEKGKLSQWFQNVELLKAGWKRSGLYARQSSR